MSGAIILGSSVPIRDNASEWILGKNSTTIQLGSTAVTNGISFQSAADSTFTYRGNNIWHAGNLTNLNQLTNGPGYITSAANWFGAVETGGTLDWNHSSNTRPGSGYTLLLGSATNGFSVGDYYHAFNLEYSSKDGTGNVTQLAISYGTPGNDIRMRGRYAGTWSSWVRILNSSNFNSFAMSGAGYSANQNLNTTSSPTFSGLTLSGTLNISGGSSGGFTNGTILWASGAGGGIKIDSPGTNLTLGTGWNEKVVLNAGTGVDMYTNNGSGTYTLRFALDRNGNQSITGALSSVGLTNTGAYSGSGGSFSHNVGNPASTTELFVHNGANTPVPFRMTKAGYTGAGGSYGILQLYMNDNTNGNGANLYFCANNSSSVFYEYGGVGMQIKSNTAGSETARLYFYRQNRAVNGTFDSDGTLYTVGNIYTNGNGTTTGNLVLNSSNYTSYGLTNNNDSEQIVGLKEAYWNFGSNRVYTDPRWNESGYDGDLGTLHIYSTTAAGVNYGRAGIALYNGSAYQYLTTKASTTGLFANNSLILTAGNYTSYAMQGAGYSANQNLNTSSGVRFATLQVGSTNSNGSLININGGNYNQFNLSYSSSAWGLLMGFGDGSASGGYHGLNHAAIINVQSGPIHFGTANSSNVQISSSGHLHPSANNTYDCGTASLAWRNVYTNDLHLSNMNKPEGNDVDGTNGNWTIQEGAENLYIINNNNGKKFKISLEEIK